MCDLPSGNFLQQFFRLTMGRYSNPSNSLSPFLQLRKEIGDLILNIHFTATDFILLTKSSSQVGWGGAEHEYSRRSRAMLPHRKYRLKGTSTSCVDTSFAPAGGSSSIPLCADGEIRNRARRILLVLAPPPPTITTTSKFQDSVEPSRNGS